MIFLGSVLSFKAENDLFFSNYSDFQSKINQKSVFVKKYEATEKASFFDVQLETARLPCFGYGVNDIPDFRVST